MCGRFTLTKKKEQIIKVYEDRLNAKIVDLSNKDYEVSYNIAPSQDVVVIYNNGKNIIFNYHRWGLIPFWAKDKKIGYKMINSRVETIAEKPSFKKSFLFDRCLIIADGYFEWLKKENSKTPYYFFFKDKNLFAFAGIRSTWKNGDEVINSCAIITMEALGAAAKVHNRMPIILDKKIENAWTNPTLNEKEQLLKLLEYRDNDFLDYYQISSAVNSPRNNYKEILRRE